MVWGIDDATMEPTRLVGYDETEPTSRNQVGCVGHLPTIY
jgi:hypothetical protein